MCLKISVGILLLALMARGSSATPPRQSREPEAWSAADQDSGGVDEPGAAQQTVSISKPLNDSKNTPPSSLSTSPPSSSPMTTTTKALGTARATIDTNSTSNALPPLHQIQPAFVYQATVPEDYHDALSSDDDDEDSSRKNIGPSVATSVSVILDGEEPQFTDAVGHKVPKPDASLHVASPINLLNPDRYEFFTFDDNGELVKRLMTMQEIQSIVANGDGEGPTIIHPPPIVERDPEKNLQEIVDSVQSVLNKEVKNNHNQNTTTDSATAPILDTPDVSSSWSMILPAVFGNTGGDIFPQTNPQQQIVMTPESELVETSTQKPIRGTKKPKPPKRKTPAQKRRPSTTTAMPSQTTQSPPQTPQVVQEELGPNESVYTGIQQYQSLASNLQQFDAFSAMNLPHIHHKIPSDKVEITTRRVFVNNQEIIETTNNRRPLITTTPKPIEMSEFLERDLIKFQQKHVPNEHNKKPNNGNRPHTTRHPGTTHKQKIKKKTTTAPKPTTSLSPTIPSTTTTTTPKPSTSAPMSTTPEPVTTITTEEIISPIPESKPISPTPTSTTVPSGSTPTTKKKKKPTTTFRPKIHHSSPSGQTSQSEKQHGNHQHSAQNRKPTSQPGPHHRPRPPIHDDVGVSTIKLDIQHKHQYGSHHKKRPRPTRPMTTKVTTTTTVAYPPAEESGGLVTQPFPGFTSTHRPIAIIPSEVPPTFSPNPPANQHPSVSYEPNRYTAQPVQESSQDHNSESYLKLQIPTDGPSASQTQKYDESNKDEDDITNLSIDQIVLTLKQDESQKLKGTKEETVHQAPTQEVLNAVKVKEESLEESVKLDKIMPSEQQNPSVGTKPVEQGDAIDDVVSKPNGSDTPVSVVTLPPQVTPTQVTITDAVNVLNTSKVEVSKPDFAEHDNDHTATTPDMTAEKVKAEPTSTAEPTTDIPSESSTTAYPAETIDNQPTQEDITTTTFKQPEENPHEYNQADIADIQPLYADTADPVIKDFTTTDTPELFRTTDYFTEEISSEVTTEAAKEAIDLNKMARLPVKTPLKVEGTDTAQGEEDADQTPLVANLEPYLNLNVIQPTDKITMSEFQTQAATVASSLVDGVQPVHAEITSSSQETTDELVFLMSDVIQQMADNAPAGKLPAVQESPSVDDSNRLTNFAHLNASFLLQPKNISSPISLYNDDERPTIADNDEEDSQPYETVHIPEEVQRTPEESDKIKVSKIPTNEEVIREEEDYLEKFEKMNEGMTEISEEIANETASRYPVPYFAEISAPQESEIELKAPPKGDETKFGEDIDDRKEAEVKWVEVKGVNRTDTTGNKQKDEAQLSFEDTIKESTKEEPSNILGLLPSTVNATVGGAHNDYIDQNITKGIVGFGAEVSDNLETSLTKTTTNYFHGDKENQEETSTEWASATEVNVSEGSAEKEWTPVTDEDENISWTTESIKATEPVPQYTNKTEEGIPDLEEKNSRIRVTSEQPETLLENVVPSSNHAHQHEISTDHFLTTTTPPADANASDDESSDLPIYKPVLSQPTENSTETHKVNASEDSQMSEEIAEEEAQKYEATMQTTKGSIVQQLTKDNLTTPFLSQETYEVNSSLDEDPYIKLGELTTKPSPPPISNVSAGLSGDKHQSLVGNSNQTEKVALSHDQLQPDHDEEDEDDQGSSETELNKTNSNSQNPETDTKEQYVTTAQPIATSTTKATTTTSTKRMNTLKPVSYFKQPSFEGSQPAEPTNVYSYLNGNFNPHGAGGNMNTYNTGHFYPNRVKENTPVHSQSQSQQSRPMQRPPSLSNLMHTSTYVTRPPVKLEPSPANSKGLEASTDNLDENLLQFIQLCNELAFSYWKSITSERISSARSLIISPFALTSMLSMVFLGARGGTSGEMNEVLKLDDMVTFNPHLVFKNVTESVERADDSNIATAAFVREIFSDRSNGKILQFFKEKTQQFYGGHVEEVNFHVVSDIIRRRTNLLIKRHTMGKVTEYLRTNSVWVNGPLATISANLFQTDCSRGSTIERDGEMFFQVHPSIRQRRLVPVPAVLYRSGFTAGYEPKLDATIVAFGRVEETVSIIYVMPGQHNSISPTDNLDRLERELVQLAFADNAWSNILTSLMDRPGMEVQLPRFSHRSFVNASLGLQKMGLKGLFQSDYADLRGLTGASNRDIYLSDMIQINTFSTCGEDKIADHHHVEMYPAPPLRKRNKDVDTNDDNADNFDSSELAVVDFGSLVHDSALGRGFYDDLLDPKFLELPLPLRPRQARVPDSSSRLRFDKPFLYFVRHNPSGLILFMGRFNPRLLP